LDCHGTNITMLWSRTPAKLYIAGVSDACAMSSFREVDKPVPSVTTTNSNPTNTPPAAPVVVKKSLQPLSIRPFLEVRRDIMNGALKNQVQHFWETMLHGKNLRAVEY
jgi:hypothetical protein